MKTIKKLFSWMLFTIGAWFEVLGTPKVNRASKRLMLECEKRELMRQFGGASRRFDFGDLSMAWFIGFMLWAIIVWAWVIISMAT